MTSQENDQVRVDFVALFDQDYFVLATPESDAQINKMCNAMFHFINDERITRASHGAGGVIFFHHVQRKNHIEDLELRRKLEDPCNNLCCRDVLPPHPSRVAELP